MSISPIDEARERRADDARRGVTAMDRTVSEHVHTLMRRTGISQRGMVIALAMSQPTLSRRMSCETPWQLNEVVAACLYFGVTLEEMTTALPSLEEWEGRKCAIRDSNPEPAD